MLGFYVAAIIGVEVGFHRYFSHRSFKCGARFRSFLGACGSIIIPIGTAFWVELAEDFLKAR